MIDKVKALKRILKNRSRFKNNYKKVGQNKYITLLDPTCMCGLEVGNRFRGKGVIITVKQNPDITYLLLEKI